jgi:Ca-activated chloride channel family protein
VNLPDAFSALARDILREWDALTLRDLQFLHRTESWLLLIALFGFSIVLLVGRMALGRRAGRDQVVVPAVLSSMPQTLVTRLVHVPLVIFLAGLPFLVLALADPQTALVRREASYPGRRICLTIDASNSMSSPFKTNKLRTPSNADGAFYTTVAAAEQFVRFRMNGRYRDLVALVEFGSQAYVVTPFTNDYDNILLSLSLIGDPREFALFPDQRTLIAAAIEQSVELFRTFEFLNASGNLMVIFSDGEDTNAAAHGRPLDDIIKSAVAARVPVYFVRTNYDRKRGDVHVPDKLWIEAVEQTGGKFFAASDEQTLLAAIQEIDHLSAGTIQLTEYSAQQPRFPVFALIAVFCFITAIASKLTVPYFQRFP